MPSLFALPVPLVAQDDRTRFPLRVSKSQMYPPPLFSFKSKRNKSAWLALYEGPLVFVSDQPHVATPILRPVSGQEAFP